MSLIAKGASSGNLADVMGKGLQGTYGLGTVNFFDTGRSSIVLFCDRITGVASETLATMSINANGTVTSATQYTVTTGKTFRITSVMFAVRATAASIQSCRGRVRAAASVGTASSIYVAAEASSPAALAESIGVSNIVITDNLEIAGGQQIGITFISSSTSQTFSCMIVGFEY